jgi:hypothetical protein
MLFGIAYKEFCAATSEEPVEDFSKQGATQITVSTTMVPQGSHYEVKYPRFWLICSSSIRGWN